MAADFTYPTSQELIQIAQDKIPRLTKDRPIFKLMPLVNKKRNVVRWEQRDNYIGLQQVRGLDGQPSRVKRIGAKMYEMTPGVYGEFVTIDETELTTRRAYGTTGTPIDIKDLVVEAQEQLLQRRLDRIEQINWTLLTTGTFSVADPKTSAILHTDTFPIQTFTATVPWSTFATATPLKDFRAVQLLSRGHSVSFGPDAEVWINQVTLNNLLANTNQSDLAGRRTAGLTTGLTSVLNLKNVNEILLGENLPQIRVYDEGYFNDANTFTLFIANNTALVMGKRPSGEMIGEYDLTLNANNPDMGPGAYMAVIDKGAPGPGKQIPRVIEVHDGHNGGPALWFPSALVSMAV